MMLKALPLALVVKIAIDYLLNTLVKSAQNRSLSRSQPANLPENPGTFDFFLRLIQSPGKSCCLTNNSENMFNFV